MSKRLLGIAAVLVMTVGLVLPLRAPAAAATGPDRKQISDDFIEALTIVEEHYADDVDYARVSKAAIFEMLQTLDPHSHFYDSEEYEAFRTQETSQYFGIGSNIGERNGKVYILAPFPNTPAERAGLRYGDQIVEINGQSTAGWPSSKVSATMKGPRGTKVAIKVSRPGVAQPIAVEITRDAVPLPTVTNAYIVAPGTGYIQLGGGFNFTTSQEVQDSIAKLKSQGMKQLILDLRENPGGLVMQAVAVANQFLYKGQSILNIRGRSGTTQSREYSANNEGPDTYPLVVMVSPGTASASEIVTGALQDHDRALVVGETSFGKGLVQTPIELEKDGGGLILTTGKYYTPSGRLIQRDYSKLSVYDYYLHRGTATDPSKDAKVFQTDTGRSIYGGGGITPDVKVAPATERRRKALRWLDADLGFTREVINGQVKGLESYAYKHPEAYHVLAADELVVTDAYFQAFKSFLSSHPEYKLSPADAETDRDIVRESLRNELAIAHFGIDTAAQVTALTDPQLQRAISELPQAQRMAEVFRRKHSGAAVEASVR